MDQKASQYLEKESLLKKKKTSREEWDGLSRDFKELPKPAQEEVVRSQFATFGIPYETQC